ncbi:uncharacterized protein LOC119170724 isoform X1 [Rhipicephalus microplus]|uniref:uncharacterized protein LOC119170724 isoform X1 n=1 Tax=Rhipicephalus microplus TaxID=6941 RepID=UPI001887485C|nr:uncharacterized protein LOC119170724 [Rhipicephalus microplus]
MRRRSLVAPPLVLLFLLFRCCVSSSSEAGQHNQLSSRGQRNVSCFQCSWLAEQPVDANRSTEVAKRWNTAYADSEKLIDNPFKPPLLGIDTFAEMPTALQLAAHCNNCSKLDGMCARWTFYGNTGKPANVTWMCVNSEQTGCFKEQVSSHFVKEVCLCADRHYCNAATAAGKPMSLLAGLMSTIFTVFFCTVLS